MAEPPQYPGAPRWVKLLGCSLLVGIFLFVFLHITGNGFGRHFSVDHSDFGGRP